MSVCCPKCGSRFIDFAEARSTRERLDSLIGKRPLRCKDCRTRFIGEPFSWHDLLFAKCPACYRMDLNTWRAQHFRARGWMALKLSLGGSRLRCEYCRINFVSMRRRLERFSFRRWDRRRSQRNSDVR